jgi:GT2 family glycosyltransferase
MTTTISIITRTSRIHFLNETIESVKNLINSPYEITWEYIIVNDGNPDVSKYLNDQSFPENFSFIDLKENVGRKKAFNLGVAKAKYDWIFVLDDDDIILQRTLANFSEAIVSNPKTKWFVSDFIRVDQETRYLMGQDYYGWKFETAEEIIYAMLNAEHFVQFNSIFRKDLFEKVGGIDENFKGPDDLDLYLRFLENTEIPEYVNFYSHLHRMHLNNLSHGMTKDTYLNTHLQLLRTKHKHLLAK